MGHVLRRVGADMVQDVDSSLIASPNYQLVELERRTRALVQAGGPWLRFKDALERLFYLAELNTHPAPGYVGSEALPDALPKRWARDRADYPVNPALAPYRPDYMPDDFDGDGASAFIPASDQALFGRYMQEYTGAYEEILDYVAYARGYINHMDGKSQSQEWRR